MHRPTQFLEHGPQVRHGGLRARPTESRRSEAPHARIGIREVADQQRAKQRRIEIHEETPRERSIELVDDDFSLAVWGFYATDEELAAAEGDGRTSAFRSQYLAALRRHGYDPSWLDEIDFTFDSVENVEKNFRGSFFYRLR